ncbi:hypothetical protein MAHJHV33_48720 [Mycobacterium avium subsp. hominissuis]
MRRGAAGARTGWAASAAAGVDSSAPSTTNWAPGLAEVAALGADGNPIAPADAGRNRARVRSRR